jgi:hypothetical protein
MAYLGKTPSQAVRSRFYFTASGGETSLAPAQVTGLSFTDANYVDVSLNGVALVSGTDYTATPSTNTISSLAALTASDVVEIVVYDVFSVFGGSVNGDFTISNGTLAAEAVTSTGVDVTGNVTMTSDDPTITMTDSSGTNDIATIQATSGALIITARDSGADGEIIFKKTDGSATDETLRITNTGKVGIGTGSPAVEAHIQTSSGNPELRIESTGANYATMSVKNSSRHYSTQIRTDQSNAYVVRDETAGANRFSIDTSGNVGIGTTSPGFSNGSGLEVANATTACVRIEGNSAAHAVEIYADSSGGTIDARGAGAVLAFDIGGSEAMRISSGNVGINQTSPLYPLHVSEASGDTAAIYIDGPTNGYSVLYLGDSDDIDRSMVSYNHTNDDLTFRAAARSSLRLNGSGTLIYENVAATAANLEINGASTNGHYNIIMNGNVNNGYKIAFKHGSSLVGSIITAGSNTSYNTSSDHRLKENVADMTGAIDRVKALAPKRFSFITDADTTVDGFLAHEAQAVVPEAVTGTHNEVDDDGNAVMQGIDQSKLVPLLTGALREAITKIETLETQRADIEARLTALENAE